MIVSTSLLLHHDPFGSGLGKLVPGFFTIRRSRLASFKPLTDTKPCPDVEGNHPQKSVEPVDTELNGAMARAPVGSDRSTSRNFPRNMQESKELMPEPL